jgi:hypothetical protein
LAKRHHLQLKTTTRSQALSSSTTFFQHQQHASQGISSAWSGTSPSQVRACEAEKKRKSRCCWRPQKGQWFVSGIVSPTRPILYGICYCLFGVSTQYNAAAHSANSKTFDCVFPSSGTPRASLPLFALVALNTSSVTTAPFTHTTSLSRGPTTGRNFAVAITSASTNAFMVFSSIATRP